MYGAYLIPTLSYPYLLSKYPIEITHPFLLCQRLNLHAIGSGNADIYARVILFRTNSLDRIW